MIIGHCGDRNRDRLSVTFAELRPRLVTGPGLVTDSVGPSRDSASESLALPVALTVALAAARAGTGPVT
jgi:hypothetical protein